MDAVRFSTAFVDLSRRKLEAPSAPETPAAGPADQVTTSGATSTPRIPAQVLARQAYMAVTALIPAVAGAAPVALTLAAEVGRSLGGAEVKVARDKLMARAGPADAQLQGQLPRLQAIFDRVSAVSTAPADLKLWGRPSEAVALGDTVFAGKKILPYADSEPCLGFIFAHELAHVEHRDSQGLVGVQALGELIHRDVGEDQWNLMERSYSHQVEFAADRRAAEMCARLGYDPRPILRMLLRAEHDGDHPGGLKRAQAVREVFAEHGVKLGSAEWKALKESAR